MLRLGLVVNSYAGVGGPLALKGSDGETLRQQALAAGAELRASARVERALSQLRSQAEALEIFCWSGEMGEQACRDAGLACTLCGYPASTLCGYPASTPSNASDTAAAAGDLLGRNIDLLLFAGGDGTARDVLDVVGTQLPVLGIPAGVKMHSGVFAVSPEAAGELLLRLLSGGLVNVQLREVRDIDEAAFRQGQVKARFYGELLVPEDGHFLQHTKVAGIESDELVASDIAAGLVEGFNPDTLYIIGPGSTTLAITEQLGLQGTLLGVDAVVDRELVAVDANAAELEALVANYPHAEIIVTAIGGQGHILGRGNQQLSPTLLRAVGTDRVRVVAGKGKISALQGRPLLVDSNDPELDRELSGYRRVVTAYQDEILYPVGCQP